jgi:hypothetical protein
VTWTLASTLPPSTAATRRTRRLARLSRQRDIHLTMSCNLVPNSHRRGRFSRASSMWVSCRGVTRCHRAIPSSAHGPGVRPPSTHSSN